jgi:hypothetical protein
MFTSRLALDMATEKDWNLLCLEEADGVANKRG